MQKTFKFIGLVLLFLITGFYLHELFHELSLSQIENTEIQFITSKMNTRFLSRVTFAMIIGSLPIQYLIIEKITKFRFLYHGLIVFLIIISSGLLLWLFRVYQLKTELMNMGNYSMGNDIKSAFPIEKTNFSLYLLLGFIIGMVLSIFIFKKRAKSI